MEKLRLEHLNQVSELKKDDPFLDPEYASDNAAIDTDVREQEYHALVEAKIKQFEKRLSNIEKALHAIEKGLYGYCKSCKNTIPAARLELVPEAQHCIACESKLRR